MVDLAEAERCPPDARAVAGAEAAARQVAGVTALVPLALADADRIGLEPAHDPRIAEIYGGGLACSVHGDSRVQCSLIWLQPVRLRLATTWEPIRCVRAFQTLSSLGEGLVNGALTARVGIAAIEVCRPMAFENQQNHGWQRCFSERSVALQVISEKLHFNTRLNYNYLKINKKILLSPNLESI